MDAIRIEAIIVSLITMVFIFWTMPKSDQQPDLDPELLDHNKDKDIQKKHHHTRQALAKRIEDGDRSQTLIDEISKELLFISDFGYLYEKFSTEDWANKVSEETLRRIARVFNRDVTKFIALRTGV